MKVTTIPVGMLGTNCHILESVDKKCAVIDPGANAEKICDFIEKNNLVPEYILLTHGHYDHIGAVKAVMRMFPKAKLYIGARDAEMLENPEKSLAVIRGGDCANFIITGMETVKENDEIQLDELTIKVLDAPGHTKGGVVYTCMDALFAGDTLFRDSVGRTDLYGGNFAILRRTLEKLAKLEQNYFVYTGHGENTTLDYERRNNQYMQAGFDI